MLAGHRRRRFRPTGRELWVAVHGKNKVCAIDPVKRQRWMVIDTAT